MAVLYRTFRTQAEIDAQYNASLRVSDAPAELRRYVTRSEQARATLPAHLDVRYGPTRAETVDIFPAPAPDAPVLVFLHGGYWRAFSSKDFSCVALGLHGAGFTTVVVNYALCPVVTIDEIVRQVRAAVAWVLTHIDTYGGDPSRVAVAGHSAGAHLTAMCLQTAWADDYGLAADPLAAAVLVSGVYDLEPLRWSYLQPAIQLDAGLVARNSPVFAVRSSPTPILVTWGDDESDEFLRQSLAYHGAWQVAGNDSTLLPQAGAHHFSAIHGFEEPESAICQWLRARVERTEPRS